MHHNSQQFNFLLIVFLLFCPILAQNVIPKKFFGAFLYDRSDNLDAYLAAKGKMNTISMAG